jgi:transcriptional regulator with XRE-family HTH domain
MAMATAAKAKPTLAEFLLRRMQERQRQVKLEAPGRKFKQGDYAEEIGMNQQTFSRYLNGDVNMTVDQAVILLRYYGPEVIPHFDYTEAGGLDVLTAKIIAALPRMKAKQRRTLVEIIDEVDKAQKAINGEQPGTELVEAQ